MKDYLIKRRAELKKRGKKGFTLMEMLIVVAIIAVLIAIAIPVFTSQLHNAQDQTEIANCRSLYGDLQADYMTHMKEYDSAATTPTQGTDGAGVTDGKTIKYADGQEATLTNGTATATFVPGKGWHVEWACGSGDNAKETWGVEVNNSNP